MAVTPANINYGICTVTYNSVDLGATAGDVTVKVSRKVTEIGVENYGDLTPVRAFESGVGMEVSAPLAEESFAQLDAIYDGANLVNAAGPATKLTFGRAAGNECAYAALVLHPQHLASGSKNSDLNLYSAFVAEWGQWAYSNKGARIRTVTFKARIDSTKTDGNLLGCFGDTAAA